MSHDHFAAKAADYEASPKRVQNVMNIAQAMCRQITFTQDMDLMDFGSGTGLLLERIAPLVDSITAVDISPSMMAELKAKQADIPCQLYFKQMDLTQETVDTVFDGIISSMTLHHIADIADLMQRLFSLLKPGGFIALADLDTEPGNFHEIDTGVHHHGFDRDWLMAQAAQAGFVDLHVREASQMTKPQGEYTVFLLSGRKPD